MTDLTGHYADVDGTRVYYETVGDATDPTIVLVHTAGSDGRQWRYVAPALAKRGYHVIVPDLPGHGKSYPPDWEPYTSIHEHAEFIWALGSYLDLESPAVGGCSIGGDTALDIAVHHGPDIRCAIVMEGTGKTRGAPLGRLSHPHALPGWQNVLDYSVVDSTGDICPEQREIELTWQHRGAHEVATNDLQAWADFDVLDELQTVACPVMVVRGDADFYIQDDLFTKTIERLPECRAVELEDIGHYPMMEQPEQSTELIAGFLDNHI